MSIRKNNDLLLNKRFLNDRRKKKDVVRATHFFALVVKIIYVNYMYLL